MDNCYFCNRQINPYVKYMLNGYTFCGDLCRANFIRVAEDFKRVYGENMQLPLPFPPSALNTPKETLKVKVKQDYGIGALVGEWHTWLNNEKQVTYNRVEFKWQGCYFVIAKLKPEAADDKD